MIEYFKDLLATLKRIESHLKTISSAVSIGNGRSNPSIRTGTTPYDY